MSIPVIVCALYKFLDDVRMSKGRHGLLLNRGPSVPILAVTLLLV